MLFFWSAALGLTFFAFLAFIIGMRLLRRTRRTAERPAETDLSLESLHALLQQGKITRQEFERARASILSRRNTDPAGPAPRRQGFEVLESRDHI